MRLGLVTLSCSVQLTVLELVQAPHVLRLLSTIRHMLSMVTRLNDI